MSYTAQTSKIARRRAVTAARLSEVVHGIEATGA